MGSDFLIWAIAKIKGKNITPLEYFYLEGDWKKYPDIKKIKFMLENYLYDNSKTLK